MDKKRAPKGHKISNVKKWPKQRSCSSDNGYVLIFVLWSLTILSTVALGFSKDTNISIKLSTVHAERVKDIYAMRGAVLYALNKMAEGGQVPEIELPKNQIGSEEVGEGEPVIAGEPPRDD